MAPNLLRVGGLQICLLVAEYKVSVHAQQLEQQLLALKGMTHARDMLATHAGDSRNT